MGTVLKDKIGVECYCFVGDLVLYSNTAEKYARILEHVLQRFDVANLQLHPWKCAFAQPGVQYLGYVLSEKGISASSDKVKAVRKYPKPHNVKDVRAFLGLASLYRRLVPDFAQIAKSLIPDTEKPRVYLGSKATGSFRDSERQVMHNTGSSLSKF
jgi:hypothetical protein